MIVYKHNNIDVYKQQKLGVYKRWIFCVDKHQKNKQKMFICPLFLLLITTKIAMGKVFKNNFSPPPPLSPPKLFICPQIPFQINKNIVYLAS